jgi:hypothetical protein
MHIDTNNITDNYIFFINNIFDNHLDTINNIYNDFKNRFIVTPFFLGNLKNTDLTNFIIDLYQRNINTPLTENHIYFQSYYSSELNLSYNIITNFLKQKTINLNLQYNNWIKFCYTFSDLYELFHSNY